MYQPTSQLKKFVLPVSVFVFVAFMLSMIQLKVKLPMLLLERFFEGGGWIEIGIVASFGAFLAYNMQDIKLQAKWRMISWTVFSVWFFIQLFLGLLVSDIFLLTGDLHLPIPAMMISGPIYRGEKSIMTILFLSTIVLTGPAWCSQLCYFGALDNLISKGKTKRTPIANKMTIKHSVLLLVIVGTIVLRLFNVELVWAVVFGIAFGVIGLVVMLFLSRRQKRMVHCTAFCPIGTVVNYFRYINPFRIYIDYKCDSCLACTSKCKYDALGIQNIEEKNPGFTCTLCGDCISACKSNSIKYKFFNLQPEKARNLYLFLTISIYSIFLAMGRI